MLMQIKIIFRDDFSRERQWHDYCDDVVSSHEEALKLVEQYSTENPEWIGCAYLEF